MIRIAFLIATVCLSQTAFASECPAVKDTTAEQDKLHIELRNSHTEMNGRAASDHLWIIWTTAPDEKSQALMDHGRERIRVADYEKAEAAFDELIAYCPHYAEGWNQRAFVHHLRQNYSAALEDIAVTLDLEPRHFGALAGRATVLISMGRTEIGHIALRAALKINPWLSERYLLPIGEDI